MANTNTKRRTAARIPPAVEARIIELSRQYPEFGAKRLLPLLQKEAIALSASSIYNILKRHGLQNCEKRFAMIQARQAHAAPPKNGADSPPPAEGTGVSPGVPRTAPPIAAGKAPKRKDRSALGKPADTAGGIPLALKLVSFAVLAVVIYSGFHAAVMARRTRQAPPSAAAAIPAPDPVEAGDGKIAAATPPAAEATIRERDLPIAEGLLPEDYIDPPPLPDSLLPPYLASTAWPVDSPWSFTIGLEEVEAWLADARRFWRDATLDPYLQDNLPAGFSLTGLKPDTIFQKMGLQNGDIIQGVNGEPITGPEQAVYFFQRVAEGGVVEIKIKRHRRTRYISLTIQ